MSGVTGLLEDTGAQALAGSRSREQEVHKIRKLQMFIMKSAQVMWTVTVMPVALAVSVSNSITKNELTLHNA